MPGTFRPLPHGAVIRTFNGRSREIIFNQNQNTNILPILQPAFGGNEDSSVDQMRLKFNRFHRRTSQSTYFAILNRRFYHLMF
jgi:hypothetical protein